MLSFKMSSERAILKWTAEILFWYLLSHSLSLRPACEILVKGSGWTSRGYLNPLRCRPRGSKWIITLRHFLYGSVSVAPSDTILKFPRTHPSRSASALALHQRGARQNCPLVLLHPTLIISQNRNLKRATERHCKTDVTTALSTWRRINPLCQGYVWKWHNAFSDVFSVLLRVLVLSSPLLSAPLRVELGWAEMSSHPVTVPPSLTGKPLSMLKRGLSFTSDITIFRRYEQMLQSQYFSFRHRFNDYSSTSA